MRQYRENDAAAVIGSITDSTISENLATERLRPTIRGLTVLPCIPIKEASEGRYPMNKPVNSEERESD